ncbi:MAG: discoidin domain-containing protein [Kiritimatiellae bacterium]|nr:discoidin domain-containing protein [Kiritimatiellia bacterium]
MKASSMTVCAFGAVLGLAAFADSCKTATEAPYDFRKRLEIVHEAGRRDPAAKPTADEFVFADGAMVNVPASVDEVLALAAKDFCDYLDVSMGVSARFARGGKGTVTISLDGNLPARAYRVETGDGVKVTAADSRAAAQALYHLEDIMNLRGAPFLKNGVENRCSMFSPRMTHSGWAVDVFPDAHLAQIAHVGMDAIVIFVKDVDKTKGANYQDVRDVIRRAKRYGLDTYLYSYVVAFFHPDDPDAKAKFDAAYGRIAAAYPEAKGIVFVGESCQFPTKDERAQPRTWNNRIPGDKRPTAGWWPCRDYPDWVKAVKASIDAHSKGMEIVFWSYNWGRQPVQPRMELIDALPKDIVLMATFEMFEPQEKRNGLNAPSADYSLSFEGPGRYFASEAERAHKRGLKLYSMSNTGGVTWDYGSAPYQPCPFQWKRRYDGIVKAQKDWGLSGLMECHHYGWWPSFVSELEKEAFTEGGIPFDTHLRMIAARDFGAANAGRAIEAWKLWSDTARDYVASDVNQYGPFRTGPSYPYNFGGKHISNGEFPISRHASNKNIARYNYLDKSSYNPELGEVGKLDVEKMNKELELLEDMRVALGKGADIFDSIAASLPPERAERARRMAGLGRYMQRTVITAINVKHGAIAHRAGDKAGVLEWAKKEYANAKAALPLVEADSRLGWEPSMEYVGGPEQIRWKLDRMIQTYTENVARGKPCTFSPEPNYKLTVGEDDVTQLTDGKCVAKGTMWTDRSAVGWKANSGGEEAFTATLDLGKEERISGFSWNTGAGVAEVTFPRSIKVEVSLDGRNWRTVGDLLEKATKERPLPAYGAYHVYRAYSFDMPCRGRYVRFTATQSKYCFCDEIEVYGGDVIW